MATDSTRRSLRTGIDAILSVLTVIAYPGLPELLDNTLGRPGATVAIE